MGRPKSRQAPRTTMSIRVSERERRQIEEKAMATGLAASAYIRTMALDGGNVDTTIHEDRQKLMHLALVNAIYADTRNYGEKIMNRIRR